jgi:ATP-binding cassette subfamily B protein
LQNIAAFRAAFTIMQVPEDRIDQPNAPEMKISHGNIVFRNLSFGYESNQLIFQDFNLSIKAGEKVGLVGHSGSGKSTLISLLLKNFKATQGDILIDYQSLYETSADSLRAQISLIPQDIMLFHRSIAENIAYANPQATQEDIEKAAEAANIHEFIESLPEKYNTIVGERGVKLSGGQRQRIAIARAILKNAPILILDEATSSLDSQTEYEIQKSINKMLELNKATVIAIAHRLSTIKHLDRIVVMEDGRILEDGTFTELLKNPKGKFKELWDHQANGMLV